MFNNRSFTVVVALALLGVVTLIFGTATSTPSAAPSTIGVSDWLERHPVTTPSIPARPMGYAELKDAQLEQRDAVQFGNANITVVGEEDSYRAMQKEQHAAMKSLRGTDQAAPVQVTRNSYDELKRAQLARLDAELYGSMDTAVAVPVTRKGYADLKDAQLEQRDAVQFGTAILPIHRVPWLNGCNLDRNEPDC